MKEYDLVISLGADCSVAHNLRYRGLRPFSLPFDWTYIVDEVPLKWMGNHIRSRFVGLCERKNLVEIPPGSPEYSTDHPENVQYIDVASGYRFINHFKRPVSDVEEYNRVSSALRRRISRMFDSISRGSRFLLVLSTAVDVPAETLRMLRQSYMKEFPDKIFDLRYLHFSQRENSVRTMDGLTIESISRCQNLYDFIKTNMEWRFLDEIDVLMARREKRMVFGCWPGYNLELKLTRKVKE